MDRNLAPSPFLEIQSDPFSIEEIKKKKKKTIYSTLLILIYLIKIMDLLTPSATCLYKNCKKFHLPVLYFKISFFFKKKKTISLLS